MKDFTKFVVYGGKKIHNNLHNTVLAVRENESRVLFFDMHYIGKRDWKYILYTNFFFKKYILI